MVGSSGVCCFNLTTGFGGFSFIQLDSQSQILSQENEYISGINIRNSSKEPIDTKAVT